MLQHLSKALAGRRLLASNANMYVCACNTSIAFKIIHIICDNSTQRNTQDIVAALGIKSMMS
jgi:hypothetical protein